MFTVRSTEQPSRQCGIVTIMTAIALISILMMAGLAFGVSQVSLDRTRLQNVLDATALGAARVLNLTGINASAETAANELFDQQVDPGALGNARFTGASLTVTFSHPGSPNPPDTFVRVHLADSVSVTNPAMGLFGPGTSLPVNTTAMAGPSAVLTAANVVPILVCGDITQPPPPAGTTFWGFTINNPVAELLNVPNGTGLQLRDIQILSPSPAGGNLTQMIAGGYDGITTVGANETTVAGAGANANALVDGINTRFGAYFNDVAGMDAIYPPDLVYAQPITYAAYRAAYNLPFISLPLTSDGAPERRVLVVPIGNCTGLVDGVANVVPILGLGCFFLNNAATTTTLTGQFIANCNGKGTPGDSASSPTIGPTKIILYGDPDPSQWGS